MKTKLVKRREIYKGKIFSVAEDTIEFEDGHQTQWELVLHNGASAVVPLTDKGEVILVKQYRNAEDGMVLEIPAGKLEVGEDPLICARRELEEEIGYQAKQMKKICAMYSAVGFSNEKLHLYQATDLIKTAQCLDEDEFIEIVYYPLDEVVKMIEAGEIQDGKTIVAVLSVYIEQMKAKFSSK
ncbi:MAG: NUDIX hydrolase [Cellulosilyticaceae bacterium]